MNQADIRTISNVRRQWKKHVTTMQIVQFLIDLVAVYFGSTYFSIFNRFRPLNTPTICLSSLFVLRFQMGLSQHRLLRRVARRSRLRLRHPHLLLVPLHRLLFQDLR